MAQRLAYGTIMYFTPNNESIFIYPREVKQLMLKIMPDPKEIQDAIQKANILTGEIYGGKEDGI